MNKKISGFLIFTGGMIGVGVFGIPFAVTNSGYLPSIVVAAVVLALSFTVHFLLVEIVIATREGKQQLPGLIGDYLGPLGKLAATLANIGGSYGALLAYLIAGSSFLMMLVSPFFEIKQSTLLLIYFVIGASLMYKGANGLPVAHLIIIAFFGVVLITLGVAGREAVNLTQIPLMAGGIVSRFLLPYGVLLFSLWGLSLVPELVNVCGKNRAMIRRILVAGFVTALGSYIIFTLLIGGISGSDTSENAIAGLVTSNVSGLIILFCALFGVLTTFSSFLAVGHTVKRTLMYDFGFPDFGAWVVGLGVPLLFYFFGLQNFVKVLGISGAVFIGMEGVLVVLTYLKMKKHKTKSRGIFLFVIGLLLLGVLVEIGRATGVV